MHSLHSATAFPIQLLLTFPRYWLAPAQVAEPHRALLQLSAQHREQTVPPPMAGSSYIPRMEPMKVVLELKMDSTQNPQKSPGSPERQAHSRKRVSFVPVREKE